jgi:hypothetical protein
LIVKDNAGDTRDKLTWKFNRGRAVMPASFGDPTASTAYAFCVYDGSSPALAITVPADAMLWSPTSKGFQYRDSAGTADGATRIKLLGAATSSKLQLKGKGSALPLPGPLGATYFSPLPTLTAQLHGNGQCYETVFSGAAVLKNDPALVKAKF